MRYKILILFGLMLLLIGFVNALTPISNCQELQDINNNLNENYYLTQDIDCFGFIFESIGNQGTTPNPFTGEFDGRGFKIINLAINNPSSNYQSLFGYNTGNLHNVGLINVNIRGRDIVGALAGYNIGQIKESYSTGEIYGNNFVGGLVGDNYGGSGKIKDSYSYANIQGTGNKGIGGLIGYNQNNGLIINSYSTGVVSGVNSQGLVGLNLQATITNSYWDIDTSGKTSGSNGIGLTDEQMKQESSFVNANWDFDNIWTINNGNDYPKLRNLVSVCDRTTCDGKGIAICTCQELQDINKDLSADYCLAQDIDCSGFSSTSNPYFEPLAGRRGSSSIFDSFTGTLDGNNHIINNLHVHKWTNNYQEFSALFERVSGTIKNLGLKNFKSEGGNYGAGCGLAGNLINGKIENSYVIGDITGGTNSVVAGGLVCQILNSNIINSYFNGIITINWEDWSHLGGLVGESAFGGLVGEPSNIINSYSSSYIYGHIIRGLVGDNKNINVVDSFIDKNVCGKRCSKYDGYFPLSSPKTTSEMMQKSTFVNWDFDNIWIIDEGNDYPRLKWQTAINPVSSCHGTADYQITGRDVCSLGIISGFCYMVSNDNVYDLLRTYESQNSVFFSTYGDLGTRKCISGIKIYIPNEKINEVMNIYVSNDANTWTKVYNDFKVDQSEQWVELSFIETIARYIKLEMQDCYGSECAINDYEIKTRDYNQPSCIPNCFEKQCGDDECGGTCSVCNTGEECQLNTCVSTAPAEVYWADLNGDKITNAEIGDSVLMIYKDKTGEQFEFGIYNKGVLIDSHLKDVSEIFDFNGNLAAKWKITQNDFDLFDNPKFIFKVDSIESEVLNVGGYNNEYPETHILSPIIDTNYIIKESTQKTSDISFMQNSFDLDDDLKLTWDFGDGQKQEFENILTTGTGDTMHNYNKFGTKTIILTAEEMTRTQKAKDYSRIYVYKKGWNIFAIIDEPVFGITGKAGIQHINGISSHVNKCFSDSNSCNTESENCEEVADFLDNKLYCYKVAEGDDLNYEWTIDRVVQPETSSSFDKLFIKPKEHIIKLKVSYNTGG